MIDHASNTSRPDEAILMLGLQLGAVWADELRVFETMKDRDDEEADLACTTAADRVWQIVHRIETTAADTFLGACVKALAQSWLLSSELASDIAKADYPSPGDRLGAAVRRILLAADDLPRPGGGR